MRHTWVPTFDMCLLSDFLHRIQGADSLRLYEMFMGPLRETKVWSTRSVDGVHRFLGRVWRLFDAHAMQPSDEQPSAEQMRTLHATIKRVSGAHAHASSGGTNIF